MLITTTEELLQYDKLMSNFEIDALAPFIEAAEAQFIKPFIGREQYNDITVAYQNSIKDVNPVALVQKDIDLLHWIRKSLAQLALGIGASSLVVMVNQNGITRTETEGRKTAYQYQELNWKNDKMKLGFTFLEELGEFLELNLTDYPFYYNSAEREARIGLFVSSAKAMRNEIGLQISQWVFLQIVPHINRVEKQVKTILGATAFDALKVEILAGNVSAENQVKLDLIRTGEANLALAKAVTQMRLKVDMHGITMVMNENSRDRNVKNPVADAQASDLIKDLLADGNAAMVELDELVNPVVVDNTETVTTIPEAVDGGFLT